MLSKYRLNIEGLVNALSSNSPGGEDLIPEEYASVWNGFQNGSLDLDKLSVLAKAVNSREADGRRISLEELTNLADYYYCSAPVFDAIEIQATRQKLPSIFSPSLTANLKYDPNTDAKWFDVYMRLYNAGIDATFEDAKELISAEPKILEKNDFWDLVSNYIVPYFLRGYQPDKIKGMFSDEDFSGKGLLSLYYLRKRNIFKDPQFINFVHVVEENFAGIKAIDNIIEFIDLYNDIGKREALLEWKASGEKLSDVISIKWPINVASLSNIASFLAKADLTKVQSFVADVDRICHFKNPSVTLDDLPTVQALLKNDDFQRILYSRKFANYMSALNKMKISGLPTSWGKLEEFIKIFEHLPDDVTVFISAVTNLLHYGFDLTMRFQTFSGSQKESEQVLKKIAESSTITKLLEVFDKKHTGKNHRSFTCEDLTKLSNLDAYPESVNWIQYDEMLPQYGQKFDTVEGRLLPLDELICLATNPKEREASLALFKEAPELFAESGIGCEGIMKAPEVLKIYRNSEAIKVLKGLGFKDCGNDFVPFIDYWEKNSGYGAKALRSKEFLDGLRTVIKKLEKVDAGAKGFVTSGEFLNNLGEVYTYFPETFKLLAKMSEDGWMFYSQMLRRSRESLLMGFDPDIKYPNGHAFFAGNLFRVLISLAIKHPERVTQIPQIIKDLGMPKENVNVLDCVLAAVEDENFHVLTDPEFQKWYKKDGYLPEISKGDDVSNVFKVLPLLYANKDILPILSLLRLNPTWKDLKELFESSALLNALRNASYFMDLKGDANLTWESFIGKLKLIASGVSLDSNDIFAKLGYKAMNEGILVQLKGKRTILESAEFSEFIKFTHSQFIRNGYDEKELPALVELFAQMKAKNINLTSLNSPEFREILRLLTNDLGVRLDGRCVAQAFVIFQSGVPMNDILGVARDLGRTLTANDVPALVAIAGRSDWRELFKDRETLEKKVVPFLSKYKPVTRKEDGGMKDISKVFRDYTERPSLSKLDKLFLMRAYMIMEALEDKTFVREVKDLVEKDIKDTVTEYGGSVVYSLEKKRVECRQEKSLSFTDGAFTSGANPFFMGGIVDFHFHALEENETKYAGPSGYLGLFEGDFWSSAMSGIPGLVVTPCGRNKNGHLILDFDLYYFGTKNLTLDLGTRIAE